MSDETTPAPPTPAEPPAPQPEVPPIVKPPEIPVLVEPDFGPRVGPRARAVHKALTFAKGDRTRAAELVGIKRSEVTQIINRSRYLSDRWARSPARENVAALVEVALGKPPPPEVVTNLMRGISQSEAEMAASCEYEMIKAGVVTQIKATETRLLEWRKLSRNDCGEPVEEQMLRTSLSDLYAEWRKLRDMTLKQFVMMSKVAATKGEVDGKRRRPGRPGFRPKGGNTTTQVVAENAFFQAPQAQIQ